MEPFVFGENPSTCLSFFILLNSDQTKDYYDLLWLFFRDDRSQQLFQLQIFIITIFTIGDVIIIDAVMRYKG